MLLTSSQESVYSFRTLLIGQIDGWICWRYTPWKTSSRYLEGSGASGNLHLNGKDVNAPVVGHFHRYWLEETESSLLVFDQDSGTLDVILVPGDVVLTNQDKGEMC